MPVSFLFPKKYNTVCYYEGKPDYKKVKSDLHDFLVGKHQKSIPFQPCLETVYFWRLIFIA